MASKQTWRRPMQQLDRRRTSSPSSRASQRSKCSSSGNERIDLTHDAHQPAVHVPAGGSFLHFLILGRWIRRIDRARVAQLAYECANEKKRRSCGEARRKFSRAEAPGDQLDWGEVSELLAELLRTVL